MLLEEAERVGALVGIHPRAVAELDQRHERLEPVAGTRASSCFAAADLTKRGWYWSRTPRSLPESSSGSTGPAEGRERSVGRLALVKRHRSAGLDVEGEVVRRTLGPAARHVGIGQRVERRVDLDDVEPLRVEAQPGLGERDPTRVPRLQQPLVGPAAGPESHGGGHAQQHRDFTSNGGRSRKPAMSSPRFLSDFLVAA